MTINSRSSPSDEGLLAGLSHFFGILVALVVWATQKDRSPFVRFQSIQAMAFDLLTGIITFLIVGCMLIFIFGGLALAVADIAILGTENNPTAEPARTFVAYLTAAPFMISCILFPWFGLIFIARLVATIQTVQGKDFRFPWLGRLVERWIQ